MDSLRDLYQQMIIDHSQKPHNFCEIDDPTYCQNGHNPLCGDKITVYVDEENGLISKVCFQGSGCAISTASASLMTDIVKGKTVSEVLGLIEEFQKFITTGKADDLDKLGKLSILSGVSEFPMRVKCATLPWHTLRSALTKTKNIVSTE